MDITAASATAHPPLAGQVWHALLLGFYFLLLQDFIKFFRYYLFIRGENNQGGGEHPSDESCASPSLLAGESRGGDGGAGSGERRGRRARL